MGSSSYDIENDMLQMVHVEKGSGIPFKGVSSRREEFMFNRIKLDKLSKMRAFVFPETYASIINSK